MMKYVLAGLVVIIILGTGYFVLRPGTSPDGPPPTPISQDNPFFKPKQVDIPFDMDKSEFGRKLFADGRYGYAVAVYSAVFSSSNDRRQKATALLTAAQALVQRNDPPSRRHARELYG